MATRTPQTFEVTDVETAATDTINDEAFAFESFAESLTGGEMGSLRVHRVPDDLMKAGSMGKGAIKNVFLFRCDVDKYTYDELLMYLRDSYGSGTYRIIGTRSGSRGVAFNRIVEIEKPKVETQVSPTAQTQPDITQAISQVAEVMASQFREVLSVLRPAEPVAPVKPLDQMKEMLTLAAMMREAFAPAAARPMDLLGELKRVKEISEMIGGGNDGGEVSGFGAFVELAKTFGPAIAQAVSAQSANAQPALPSPGARPPRPSRQRPTAPPPNYDPPENNQMPLTPDLSAEDKNLREQVLKLVSAAAFLSPDAVANNILDVADDETLDELEPMARNPNMIVEMMRVAPEATAKRDWLDAFQKVLISGFDEMATATDELPEPVEPAFPTDDTGESSAET